MTSQDTPRDIPVTPLHWADLDWHSTLRGGGRESARWRPALCTSSRREERHIQQRMLSPGPGKLTPAEHQQTMLTQGGSKLEHLHHLLQHRLMVPSTQDNTNSQLFYKSDRIRSEWEEDFPGTEMHSGFQLLLQLN